MAGCASPRGGWRHARCASPRGWLSLFAARSCTLTDRWLSGVPLCAADGVYTGEWTTMALCGFIRGMGEGDGCLDRLWTKSYDEAKAAGSEI